MELGLARSEVREFNKAVTLYHRAGREQNEHVAWQAVVIFERLGNLKWAEMARELYYELKGCVKK